MRSIVPSMCSYLIVFLVASGSWATTMVRMTDEELIERSSLIVIGQCTAASSAWMGRRLVTLATIAVYEVLKGEPHTEVTVVLPGGMDAQRKVPVAAVVAGGPQLSPAEEVVLFLSSRKDEHNRYTITGWAQGKLAIMEDATGRQIVSPDRVLLPPHDAWRTAPPLNSAGGIPLAQFRDKILHRVGSSSHSSRPGQRPDPLHTTLLRSNIMNTGIGSLWLYVLLTLFSGAISAWAGGFLETANITGNPPLRCPATLPHW